MRYQLTVYTDHGQIRTQHKFLDLRMACKHALTLMSLGSHISVSIRDRLTRETILPKVDRRKREVH